MKRLHWRWMGIVLAAVLVLTGMASGALTAALLFPLHEPALRTPATYGVPYETLAFNTPTGSVLRGWFMPNGISHGRTVLVLHGISANKAIFLNRGLDVYRLGYNVLMLDLRNHGESTGEMTTYGWLESREVEAALEQLQRRRNAPGIAVVGYSLGGATALQMLPYPIVRGVVSDSAFCDLQSMMAYRGEQWHVPSWPFQELCQWEVSVVAPFQVDQASPLRAVSESRKPVLLIHGGRDSSVPLAQAIKLSNAGDPNLTFWEVPEAGHCGAASTEPQQYVHKVGAFLSTLFGRTPPGE